MYAIFGALSLSEVISSLTYSRWDTAVLIYFILALGRCVPNNNFPYSLLLTFPKLVTDAYYVGVPHSPSFGLPIPTNPQLPRPQMKSPS